MSLDIALSQTDGMFDIYIDDSGDLAAERGLDTAIYMSLLCERRASQSEIEVSWLRRGWIGNQYAEREGFEIGSKIWLWEQARLTQDTANSIADAARRGLQWLVDDQIAIRVQVEGTVVPSTGISLGVTLYRPTGDVEYRNIDLWEFTGDA